MTVYGSKPILEIAVTVVNINLINGLSLFVITQRFSQGFLYLDSRK